MRDTRSVYVVDAEYASRKELEHLLCREGFRVQVSASLERYLALPEKTPNSCVVVQSALPLSDALTLNRYSAGRAADPFILISQGVGATEAVQIMKAGAVDLLTEPVVPEVLLSAVTTALRRSMKMYQRKVDLAIYRPRYQSLSRREREVLPLIIGGFLNKQAASVLGIAEITLQVHRAQIMRKMEANSLPDLVRMSMQLGIDPAPRELLSSPAPVLFFKGNSTRPACRVQSAEGLRERHVSSGLPHFVGAAMVAAPATPDAQ